MDTKVEYSVKGHYLSVIREIKLTRVHEELLEELRNESRRNLKEDGTTYASIDFKDYDRYTGRRDENDDLIENERYVERSKACQELEEIGLLKHDDESLYCSYVYADGIKWYEV